MGGTNERDRFFTHRLITRARLSSAEKLTLFALWDFENSRTGFAWPTLATLAAVTGLSDRTVSYALKRLIDRRVLGVSRKTNRPTVRAIDYDALAAIVHPEPTQPAPQPLQSSPQPLQSGPQPLQPGPQPLQTNIRRTQEEKKREHAPPTFLSASRKGPKARHPGASGASDVSMNDLSHEEFEARLREMLGWAKEDDDA